MQAILGIVLIFGLCVALSKDRSSIQWRFVVSGFVIQFALAILFLKVAWIAEGLLIFNTLVTAIEQATRVGTEFMFGFFGGADAPFAIEPG